VLAQSSVQNSIVAVVMEYILSPDGLALKTNPGAKAELPIPLLVLTLSLSKEEVDENGSRTKWLNVWDLQQGALLTRFPISALVQVTALLDPTQTKLAIQWVEGMKYDCGLTVADDSDDDSTSHLHVWEFASSSVLFSVDKQEIPAILCFDWTGNHLFSSDAAIRDSRTGTISRQFSMNDEPNCLEVELACFSEDNSSVIGVTAEMNTIVWDVASGQILQIARSRERAVGLFGCQGTWCILGYYTDNYYANRAPVVVWDYLSGENVWNKSTSKAFISSACFGKIGGDRPVAVVGDSDYLMVWDIADDIELHRIPCVRGIDHVAFVPVGDSNMIVYSEDKRIHAIECDTWKEVAKVSLSGDCGTIHKVYEKFHQILLL
jgi:WD40 repeat protein